MPKTLPFNIILLGDPAAGKATHGKFLAKKFNLYNLDMGNELRMLDRNPSLRKKYRLDLTLNKGKLTPTDIVRKLLFQKIHLTPKNQGILFNGTPKMIGEAKLVAKWLKKEKRNHIFFIYLAIPLQETIKRMTTRKAYYKGKFSKRPDDNNIALKNRIKYYRDNISHVVKYFKSIYPFCQISTMGNIPFARKKLIAKINNLSKRTY